MSSTQTTQRPLSAVVLTAFVVFAAVSGVVAFVGAAAAANTTSGDAVNGAVVSPQPARVGANSTHVTHLPIHAGSSSVAGSSWDGYRVNYLGATDVSNVDQSDILVAGIDDGNDEAGRTVDTHANISGVSASNNGHSLKLTLSGATLENGDELVVVYEDVQNPTSAGNESVELVANPQSSGYTNTTQVSYHPPASVTLDDQTVNGSRELVVDSAYLPEGGSVTIENANGTQVATTGSLDAGSYENLTVTLPKSADPGTYTATARQPDGDAYQHNDGTTVTDTATVALDYDFAAAFENSTRTNARYANLTFTADNGDYNVRVSANNLTSEDLRAMFGTETVIASDASADTVTVPGGTSTTHRLNVSNYTGNYTFHATNLQTNNADDASLSLHHTDTTNDTSTSDTTTTTTTSDTTTTTTSDTTTTTDSTVDDSDWSDSSTDSTTTTTTTSDETSTSSTTESAGVAFTNQTLADGGNQSVVVQDVTLPEDGYLVLRGSASGVVGHTALLDAGNYTNVSVSIDTPANDTRLRAVVYDNTDNATAFTQNDTTYQQNGSVVADAALIHVADDANTQPAQTTTPTTSSDDPRPAQGGIQWIGLLALLALVAAGVAYYRLQL